MTFLVYILDHERKNATAGSSPVSSPKSSRKFPRGKTEKAMCKIGAVLSTLALGRDFTTVAKNMNDVRMRSGSRERRKSPSSRRSREVGRKSWFGGSSSSDITESEGSQRDSIFGSRSFLPDFARGNGKRPISTPVMLKSVTYPRTDLNSTATTIASVGSTTEQPLIDLCEVRDRRSKSLGAYELNLVSVNENSSTRTSSFSLDRKRCSPEPYNGSPRSPPPISPRAKNEINSNHVHKHLSNVKGPYSTNDGQFENIANSTERVGVGSTNGSDILTERERLTLLDVNVDGQHEDQTQPLLRPANSTRKPLDIKEFEKELLR